MMPYRTLLAIVMMYCGTVFAMGSKKPWYDGPSERKDTMAGWINHAINCMPAPKFNKSKVQIKYIPVIGIKKFPTGWGYQASNGMWVHGETFFKSSSKFDVKVAVSPDRQWDRFADLTEGHEIGHVVAYNQFKDTSHNRKWSKCFHLWMSQEIYEIIYDENGNILHAHGLQGDI